MPVVYEENKALHKISDEEVAQRLASGSGLVDLDLSEYPDVINTNPGTTFVGCSFRSMTFKKAHLRESTFEGCDFTSAVFEPDCEIANCYFNPHARRDGTEIADGTILDDVAFKCPLRGVRLNGVRLNRTSFEDATWGLGKQANAFDDSHGEDTVFGGVVANLQLSKTSFVGAEFRRARFAKLEGRNNVFVRCCFDDSLFNHCVFDSATFFQCSFQRAKLGAGFQGGTDLASSDFRNAYWQNATLQNVTIDGAKLWPCTGLTGRYQATLQNIQGAERAVYQQDWLDGWFSWSHIRWISSVPLFGVSYFALVAICIWASAVHWSNTQITRFKADERTAEWLASIDHLPTGWRMAATLSAIVALAIGATTYRVRCPKEIQENSETFWTFNLKEERMRYLALAVTKRWSRYIAGVTSYLGAAYILFDLSYRVIESFTYLWPDAVSSLKSVL